MRLRNVIASVLGSLVLPALPAPADALLVTIRATNGADVRTLSRATFGSGVQTTPNGIPTTTVEITRRTTTGAVANRTLANGFVISRAILSLPATAIAEQSGSLERITINNAVITSPNPCGPPCTVEIIVTSDTAPLSETNTIPPDFPSTKNAGAQPAAVLAQGFFIPGLVVGAPAGSKIATTGRAAGTNLNGTRRAVNVINPIPRGTGDSPTSLASDCSGQADCAFIATDEFNVSFNDNMGETIQYACEVSPCTPYLQVTTFITFANPGDAIDLPIGLAQSRTGTAEPLREEFLPTPGNMDVRHLIILLLSDNLALESTLTPDGNSNGFNPSRESVLWSVGPFKASFPAGSFKRLVGTQLFTAFKKIGGVEVAAAFVRLSDGRWKFFGGAHGFDFTGTENPVPVQLSIGGIRGDTFSALATATFFEGFFGDD